MPVVLAQPLDQVAAQPARALAGEGRDEDSSTRSSWITCSVAVYGSGCVTWPCASMPSARSVASARRSRRSASGCGLARVALRGDDQEARRRALRPLADPRSSGSPTTVSFATRARSPRRSSSARRPRARPERARPRPRECGRPRCGASSPSAARDGWTRGSGSAAARAGAARRAPPRPGRPRRRSRRPRCPRSRSA